MDLREHPTPERDEAVAARAGWALPFAYAAAPALLVLAADLAVRWRNLHLPTPRHVFFYAFSVVVSVAFWLVVAAVLGQLFARRPALAWTLAIALGALEGLLLVGSQGYYAQFGVLPNLFGFEYVYEEPKDAAAFFATGAGPGPLLAWGAIGAACVAWVTFPRWSTGATARRLASALRGRWTVLPAALVLLAGSLVLHNNVRHFPNAFVPEVHTVFSFTKATERALSGRSKAVRLLGAGMRPRLTTQAGELGFDVLVLLNEGVRRSSLPTYGYGRDTTPNLRRFLEENADRTAVFDRAYAVATRTLLAFPSFLTGVHPAQPGTWMHTQPLLFDYAKRFSNVDTFLLASLSYGWGNFVDFVRTPSLDQLWYQEISGLEAKHGTGIDDAHLPRRFQAFLDGLAPGRRFFGVLQFYGTHQGYDSRPEDRLWGDANPIDRYDAAIHYLDRNTEAVLEALRRSGRLDDTLIVFVSDHGEAFGEHGYFGHIRTYYDEEARVPFWIRLPRRLAGRDGVLARLRRNASAPVSNADLLPTLLALTGLDAHPEIQAHTARLVGLPLTGPIPPDRPLRMKNLNDIGSENMFTGAGLLKGDYKLLVRNEGGRSWEELYDLRADPLERNDLAGSAPPALVSSLRAEANAVPAPGRP
jgi:glucan phosphoethanolaminetransferase (alkaline phosphatase superfamily)